MPEPLEFAPGSRIAGQGRVPGSKSLAQRSLAIACWSRGISDLRGLPPGQDAQGALVWARGLAGLPEAGQEDSGEGGLPTDRVRLRGRRFGSSWPIATIRVGESGTLARFSTALAGLSGAPHELQVLARGSLRRRRSPALLRALVRAGATVEPEHAHEGMLGPSWPLRLRPARCPFALFLDRPSSSQEISALCLAAAAAGGQRVVRWNGPLPSRPYAEMTWAALRDFGMDVQVVVEPDRGEVHLSGFLESPGRLQIEPDASAAAVLLAAGALTGGRVNIAGLGEHSTQGDVRIVEHLRAFGIDAHLEAEQLWAAGLPQRPVELDLADTPDLAPVIAAVAAALALGPASADTPSVLTGLETLRGKETDRIAVLARALRALGLRVEAGGDRLTIAPGDKPSGDPGGRSSANSCAPIQLSAQGDHRMAFAFALLSLVRPGVEVLGIEAADKSWPGFASELQRLGARLAGTPKT